MNTNTLLYTSRRWTLGLLIAILVTLSAVYTPVILQEMAGVNVSLTAYACGPHSSGGDC